MNEDPVVSVVLPTFNGSRYITDAIESCLAQTFQRWELIVVDDCSDDSTPTIVAGFVARDSRIRVLRHETNRRLPAALNTGFRTARGTYLTWTSDDNIYRPEAIGSMREALERHADVDIVYADVTYVDEDGAEMYPVAADPPEELAVRNCVGACFLFRRQVYETLEGYDDALFMAEDYDFWLRASSRFRFLPYHRDLYRYRWHSRSLTSQVSRQARAIVAALEKNLPGMQWLSRSQRAHAYLDLAGRCWQIRDGRRARRCLREAWRLQPRAVVTTRPTILLGLICGFSLRSLLRSPRGMRAAADAPGSRDG